MIHRAILMSLTLLTASVAAGQVPAIPPAPPSVDSGPPAQLRLGVVGGAIDSPVRITAASSSSAFLFQRVELVNSSLTPLRAVALAISVDGIFGPQRRIFVARVPVDALATGTVTLGAAPVDAVVRATAGQPAVVELALVGTLFADGRGWSDRTLDPVGFIRRARCVDRDWAAGTDPSSGTASPADCNVVRDLLAQVAQ